MLKIARNVRRHHREARPMFPFSAGQWDATLSSRCHDDGASLGLPFGRRSGARRRAPFLFTRVITYEFPDQRRAEIEVIVASKRLWGPRSCPESCGWKVFRMGPLLVLALRLSLLVE